MTISWAFEIGRSTHFYKSRDAIQEFQFLKEFTGEEGAPETI